MTDRERFKELQAELAKMGFTIRFCPKATAGPGHIKLFELATGKVLGGRSKGLTLEDVETFIAEHREEKQTMKEKTMEKLFEEVINGDLMGNVEDSEGAKMATAKIEGFADAVLNEKQRALLYKHVADYAYQNGLQFFALGFELAMQIAAQKINIIEIIDE